MTTTTTTSRRWLCLCIMVLVACSPAQANLATARSLLISAALAANSGPGVTVAPITFDISQLNCAGVTPTLTPVVTEGQGTPAPSITSSSVPTNVDTTTTAAVVTPTVPTLAPTTTSPSATTWAPMSPCQVKCVLSIPLEKFVEFSTSFVSSITYTLNIKFSVKVTLTSYAAGSTIVLITVEGAAPSSNDILAALETEIAEPTSTLSSVYSLQSVSLVTAPVVPVAPNVGLVDNGATSSGAPSSSKKGASVAAAVGAGVGGGIALLLIVILIAKRHTVHDMCSNSPASQLRRLRRSVATTSSFDKLQSIADEGAALRRKCICEFTGACNVCIAYKALVQDCCWCRTEIVLASLRRIIGKARGPDVVSIQYALVDEVQHISNECGCNYGREWAEPAAVSCPHEALVHEFNDVVRLQNVQGTNDHVSVNVPL